MKNFILFMVVLLNVNFAYSQKTGSRETLVLDMTQEQFTPYVLSLNSFIKLREIAGDCFSTRQYVKATIAYEHMVDVFSKKVKKKDVGVFYACLLKTDRAKDIPYPGLERFNEDLLDLVKIATLQNEIKRNNKSIDGGPEVVELPVNSSFVYGFSINNKDRACFTVTSKDEKQVDVMSYAIEEDSFGHAIKVNCHFDKNKIPVAAIQLPKGGNIYTVFDYDLEVSAIDIRANFLPNFPYNSKKYSLAMPFWDQENGLLYYCSDSPDGFGGWDIYSSQLKDNVWMTPVLLSDKINTELNESFPAVYNGNILFSSDGRKGKGGVDNYAYSIQDDQTWNLWYFNSLRDDYCLRSLNNKKGKYILCKNDKAFLCESDDFWKSAIRENDIDQIMTLILDGEEYRDLTRFFEMKPPEPSPKMITELTIEPITEKLKPLVQDLKIVKQYVSSTGEVSAYYPFNSEFVLKGSFQYLNDVLKEIGNQNQIKNVLIFGQADSSGDRAYNYYLSLKRANQIVAYFEKNKMQNYSYRTLIMGEEPVIEGVAAAGCRRGFIKSTNFDLPYKTMMAIKKDDKTTLVDLAVRYNNSIEILRQLNKQIGVNELSSVYFVGIQSIHRVVVGETIFSISKKYKCDSVDILRANTKKSNRLSIGEILVVPIEE
jgi:hypothetical protein